MTLDEPDFSEMQSPIEGHVPAEIVTNSWRMQEWLMDKVIGFRFTSDDLGHVLGLPRHHGSISGFLAKAQTKGIIEKREMAGEAPDYVLMRDASGYGARRTISGEGSRYEETQHARRRNQKQVSLATVSERLLELAADVASLATHQLDDISTDDLLAELKKRMK